MPERSWESLLVEVLRFGGDQGILRAGDPYLVVRGEDRARKYEMALDHEDFLDLLDQLRYVKGTSDDQRSAAMAKLAALARDMLRLDPAGPRDVQVDLVLTAKELAALPFEAIDVGDGPLLTRAAPAVEITRRVRGAFRERTTRWPAKPRVLLIAAGPSESVPLDEHRQALYDALDPWTAPLADFAEAVPDARSVITVLEAAKLADVRDACAQAAYTHVHVLAHGRAIAKGMRTAYGIELYSEDGKSGEAVGPEDLIAALRAGHALPSVMTLMACDSGNVGSPVVSTSSVAHALHTEGVPVVLGTQFPLTITGSAILARSFYTGLFAGHDVRSAIHDARIALHESDAGTEHDWLSLVAYVQLPEGYQDQLVDVRLKAELASLETAQRWADHLVEQGLGPEKYETVADRLQERIDQLEAWSQQPVIAARPDVRDETRGLRASAYKRLAELLARRAALDADPVAWTQRSREALEKARDCYAAAYAENLSAHWIGVQQLSLEAVLDGEIAEPWRWHAVLRAAETASNAQDEYWACGTRAELHLLAPYAHQDRQMDEVAAALADLLERAPKDDPFPVHATERQLRRYIDWWTAARAYFPNAEDLVDDATRALQTLALGR
jgi:hypothetical protein